MYNRKLDVGRKTKVKKEWFKKANEINEKEEMMISNDVQELNYI